MKSLKILAINSNFTFFLILKTSLEPARKVKMAEDVKKVIKFFKKSGFDLVIMNDALTKSNETSVKKIKKLNPSTETILMVSGPFAKTSEITAEENPLLFKRGFTAENLRTAIQKTFN